LPGSIAYNVSAGLLQPIFNRNALKAQFKVRKSEQLIALYDYEKSIVTGVQEVVSQLNKIENYKKIMNLKKQEVDMLKEAVTISNDLFATGNATYIEVITTQRMVLDEEINYTRYQLEEINGAINLYKALGGGWK
jgi:outer membrane protein TolC